MDLLFFVFLPAAEVGWSILDLMQHTLKADMTLPLIFEELFPSDVSWGMCEAVPNNVIFHYKTSHLSFLAYYVILLFKQLLKNKFFQITVRKFTLISSECYWVPFLTFYWKLSLLASSIHYYFIGKYFHKSSRKVDGSLTNRATQDASYSDWLTCSVLLATKTNARTANNLTRSTSV